MQLFPLSYLGCGVEFMGKESSLPRREEVLRKMYRMGQARVNDVVRLAYLTQEQADQIGSLDLRALKEFKRSSTGSVEIRLVDRVEVLEKVMALLDHEGQMSGSSFLQAMQDMGQEDGWNN